MNFKLTKNNVRVSSTKEKITHEVNNFKDFKNSFSKTSNPISRDLRHNLCHTFNNHYQS